ncbi:hypothetical protein N7493_003218 [Penicillium malachiteum]|uniref:Uncharacterized protein n=1 Tax=Penicillium malachiteum TaxID=1324776 RepID=A0AAD6HU15_9EURO|nr:hypothetical protein N7493_003218 [Penicillium malachiteum]
MSSPRDTKSPPTKKKNVAAKDGMMFGLTQSEIRLLLLGSVYADSNGRIDFERVSAHGGTVSSKISAVSAKTMHLKARRKLQNSLGVDVASASASSSAQAQSTRSTNRSTAKGKGKGRPKVISEETSDVEDHSTMVDAPKAEPNSDSEHDVLSPGAVSPKVESEDEDVMLPDPPAGLSLSDEEV